MSTASESASVAGIAPTIDVVIAVHSAARPIGRAVRSLTRAAAGLRGDATVRVLVVCHGIRPDDIAAAIGDDAPNPGGNVSLRLLHHVDDRRSPAGPFNAGLAAATAEFVMIMGSDDMLEPAALRDWLALSRRAALDVCFAPQRHSSGAPVRTPVVRVWRRTGLDIVRDRLAYRTAPLALIRTDVVDRLGLRLTEGLATGDDLEMSVRLYGAPGLRIGYPRRGGAYVVGADATDRITLVTRHVPEELRFVTLALESPWFAELDPRVRRAVVTKIIRIHVFGHASIREWDVTSRAEIATITGALVAAEPRSIEPLSRADRHLLDALLDTSIPSAEAARRALARRRFGRPGTLVPRGFGYLLHREAPLRFMTASLALR